MIETALAVNGQDCTNGGGNTPEEYEAIAVTLLRVAQAIRDREHGLIQCLSKDGRTLASVIVHNREFAPDEIELQFPSIETLHCIGQPDGQQNQTKREFLSEWVSVVNGHGKYDK